MSHISTSELFCKLLRDDDGRTPRLIKAFPGKLIFSNIDDMEIDHNLSQCQNIGGMIYVLETPGKKTRIAELLPYGDFIVSPVGDYLNECIYYQIKNDNSRLVFEQDDRLCEEATCAEIDWRMNINRKHGNFLEALDAYLSAICDDDNNE